jgi:hypothetical protein
MARPSIAAGPGEVARLVFEPEARILRPVRSAGRCRAIRARFLLGTFLCTSKEKYLARGARTAIIAFESRAKRANHLIPGFRLSPE